MSPTQFLPNTNRGVTEAAYLLPTPALFSTGVLSETGYPRPLDHIVDADPPPSPWVPRVENIELPGPMGVPSPRCIMKTTLTQGSDCVRHASSDAPFNHAGVSCEMGTTPLPYIIGALSALTGRQVSRILDPRPLRVLCAFAFNRPELDIGCPRNVGQRLIAQKLNGRSSVASLLSSLLLPLAFG